MSAAVRATPRGSATLDSGRSWVTAALAFVAMFVAVGTGYSFGALVLPVSRELGVGPGATSGVFAVSVMAFFLVSAPAGILADRFGPRAVVVAGALAMSGGLALTAGAQTLTAVYVGHGGLVGVGMSTAFVPLVAAVGASFRRHRLVAVGVAVSGIGVGTLVMAPVVAGLIGLLGWRAAYFALAVACGLLLAACGLGMPLTHRADDGVAQHSLGSMLTAPPYPSLYLAQGLLAVALFVPFAHLPAFAEDLGSSAVAAAALVGVIGGSSVVGRLALGPVANRWGLIRTYQGCYAAIGASFVAWFVPSAPYPVLLAHAVVFGLGYGGFVALLPGVLAEHFGVAHLGGLLGVVHTSHVFGAAIGPLALGLLVGPVGYVPVALGAMAGGLGGAAVLGRLRRSGAR